MVLKIWLLFMKAYFFTHVHYVILLKSLWIFWKPVMLTFIKLIHFILNTNNVTGISVKNSNTLFGANYLCLYIPK